MAFQPTHTAKKQQTGGEEAVAANQQRTFASDDRDDEDGIEPELHHRERVVSVESAEAIKQKIANGGRECFEPGLQMLAGKNSDGQTNEKPEQPSQLPQPTNHACFISPDNQAEAGNGTPDQWHPDQQHEINRIEDSAPHERKQDRNARQLHQNEPGQSYQGFGEEQSPSTDRRGEQKL